MAKIAPESNLNLSQKVALLLSLGGFVFLQYFSGRTDLKGVFGYEYAPPLMAVFGILIVLYFISLTLTKSYKDQQWALGAGVLFRIAVLFALPNLSDDFYRFFWDGKLWLDGQQLLAMTPTEWIDLNQLGPGYAEIFPNLNSQNYYSVYPPVLQWIFALSVWLGRENLWASVVIMKLFVLIAEIGTFWVLKKLLKAFNKPAKWILVYALNPLVVIETVGNLHFEALMLCFSLWGVYWLFKAGNKWTILLAALPFALGICAKLLPILFFPLLIRRLGWAKAIALGLLTGLLSSLFFLSVFNAENLVNFTESVRLYFQSFEFNANFYYLGQWLLGENAFWINRISPLLVTGLILVLALRDKDKSWARLPLLMLVALALYQLAQPVIHPWYLVPLIGLASLTRYRFPVVWAMLIPWTYLTYFHPEYQQLNWVIWIEYSLLFAYLFFEWQFRGGARTLEDWVREKPSWKKWLQKSIPARMAIKLDRIEQHLDKKDRILDLGTGNGGLCLSLRERGYTVQPVDVQNISFFEGVQPLIYDGERLPFAEGHFDVGMVITVLHHTPDPDSILDELVRVSGKKVIVMEDIYTNVFQKYLTFFTDSLVNLEFSGHPHTNKSDQEWQIAFNERGLKLISKNEFRTLLFFRQVIYVLEK